MFSLGGTIAMTQQSGSGGVQPALSAEDLLAAVPGLADLDATIDMHDFRRIPGASLTYADLLELASSLTGFDGVVITQGTDTIEETAYVLDLVYDGDAPVVV